jgi:hypothetical protein
MKAEKVPVHNNVAERRAAIIAALGLVSGHSTVYVIVSPWKYGLYAAAGLAGLSMILLTAFYSPKNLDANGPDGPAVYRQKRARLFIVLLFIFMLFPFVVRYLAGSLSMSPLFYVAILAFGWLVGISNILLGVRDRLTELNG